MQNLHPKQPGDFARWLAQNSDQATEVWLVFYKKTSGRQTIAYKNALQEALCYGWIDSRVKSMDVEKFKVRFTPRKPGSPWSRRNLKLAGAAPKRKDDRGWYSCTAFAAAAPKAA